jgi:hypothetical protein
MIYSSPISPPELEIDFRTGPETKALDRAEKRKKETRRRKETYTAPITYNKQLELVK